MIHERYIYTFGLQVTITFYNPPLSLHEHFKRPLACVLA